MRYTTVLLNVLLISLFLLLTLGPVVGLSTGEGSLTGAGSESGDSSSHPIYLPLFRYHETRILPVVRVTERTADYSRPALVETNEGRLLTAFVINGELWSRTSIDDGDTWAFERKIDGGSTSYPSLALLTDNTLWLSYLREGDIWYRISVDHGATWTAATQLTTDPGFDFNYAVLQAGDGTLWVMWFSNRSGNFDLWYKIRTRNGNWSVDTRLTSDNKDDYTPAIAQTSDGRLVVVWNRGGALWQRVSSDSGATWSDEKRILECCRHNLLRLAAAGDDLLLAYGRDGDIWYRTSSDQGDTWSDEARYTHFVGEDGQVALTALASHEVGLVWLSNRSGNNGIWFGIPGRREDINAPPYIEKIEHQPSCNPKSGDPITFRTRALDETGVTRVQLVWELDGVVQPDLSMFDDGAHFDDVADDGVWGIQHAPLPGGSQVTYSVRATDTNYNVYLHPRQNSFTVQPPFSKTADILLVLDFPDYSASSRLKPYYTQSLELLGYRYDIWDMWLRCSAPDSTILSQYQDGIVIWAMPYGGKLSTGDDARTALQGYLDAGGKLFITGESVAYATGGTSFLHDYLHASYVASARLHKGKGGVGDPIGDKIVLDIGGRDSANTQYLTVEVDPIAPAQVVFTYQAATGVAEQTLSIETALVGSHDPEFTLSTDESGMPHRLRSAASPDSSEQASCISSCTAGLRVSTGIFKAVYFAFGFEDVNGAALRAGVMERVLAWLEGRPPRPVQLTPENGQPVPVGAINLAWLSVPTTVTAADPGVRRNSAAASHKDLTIWWARWDQADYLQEIGDWYEQETGVKVNVVQQPWGSYYDWVSAEWAASGTNYDMVVGESRWLGEAVTAGHYADMTAFLVSDDIKDSVTAATLKNYSEYPADSGKYYAYPTAGDAIGWAYRKDLIEDYTEQEAFRVRFGYSYSIPPKDYNELLDLSRFWHRSNGNPPIYGPAVYTQTYYDAITTGFQNALFTYGCDWNHNFIVEGFLNRTECVQSLEAYKALYDFGPPNNTDAYFTETNDAFINGQAVFAMNYFAFLPSLAEPSLNPWFYDKVGFFSNPPGPYGQQTASHLGRGISINAYIPDERKQAAFEFIKWFAQNEVQMRWAELGGFTCNETVLASDGFLTATPYNAAFAESMRVGKGFYNIPEFRELLPPSQKALSDYVVGGKDTALKTLETIAAEHDRILKHYGYLAEDAGYEFQIDSRPTFDSPELVSDTVSGVSASRNFATPGTRYWRVRALPDGEWIGLPSSFTVSWPLTQVTTNPADEVSPALVHTANGKLLTVFSRDEGLWSRTSTDDGATWSDERQINGCCHAPSLARATDGTLWLTYGRDGTPWYRFSTDHGVSWTSETRLPTDSRGGDNDPVVLQTAEGKLWIVWASWRTDGLSIWYKTSTDGGATWSNDSRLSSEWDSAATAAVTADGRVVVAWVRYGGLWQRSSSDGGVTWTDESLIANCSGLCLPSLAAVGEVLWLAYPQNGDVWYRISRDGGETWSDATQYTRHKGFDGYVTLAALGSGKAGFVWTSDRGGNQDIWFGISGEREDVHMSLHLPLITR